MVYTQCRSDDWGCVAITHRAQPAETENEDIVQSDLLLPDLCRGHCRVAWEGNNKVRRDSGVAHGSQDIKPGVELKGAEGPSRSDNNAGDDGDLEREGPQGKEGMPSFKFHHWRVLWGIDKYGVVLGAREAEKEGMVKHRDRTEAASQESLTQHWEDPDFPTRDLVVLNHCRSPVLQPVARRQPSSWILFDNR